ncbi:MAG: glutaminase A [Synergistaceae bacterium]|nr:glutaminase A [Synergistaceae bacterium]
MSFRAFREEDLAALVNEVRPLASEGKVATYIPELARGNPKALAVAAMDGNGSEVAAGDKELRFTMQSISKVVSLSVALSELGEKAVFSRVGMDPTADPFNSVMRLEMVRPHRPQNPLINAGAIVVDSMLLAGGAEEAFHSIREMARRLTGNPQLRENDAVYLSEKRTGDRNRSLAYFLKSVKTIRGDVEEILDVYFRQCSLEVTVSDLAVLAGTLAFDGKNPLTGETVLPGKICRILRALMATCGLYDGSGEFAVRVGIPAKSGVGGGIVATVPGIMGIAVCGPALDHQGNSIAGIALLERLSDRFGLRVL